MKKMIFLLLAIAALSVACAGSLASKGTARMKKQLRGIIADPNLKIEGEKLLVETDSICVIRAKVRYINEHGGYEMDDYEYVILRDSTGVYDDISYILPGRSILYSSEELARHFNKYSIENYPSEEHLAMDMLYNYACMFHKANKVE